MNPLQLAAFCFVVVMVLKFVVGAIDASKDFTSDVELAIIIVTAAVVFAVPATDTSVGEAFLAAALAMFATTGWTALQFWKLRTLSLLASGGGRR